MSVDVVTLWGWDGGRLQGAARQARVRAAGLSELAAAVQRHGEGLGWAGAAATAHQEAASALIADLRAAAADLDLLGELWHVAGDVVGIAVGLLDRARALVRTHDLVLLADGVVLVGPEAAGPAVPAAAAAQAMAQEALSSAAEATRDAAAATGGIVSLPAAQLGSLGRTALVSTLSARELPRSAETSAQVAAWWASLPPAVQRELEVREPDVLGRLDGVPVDVRDRANRVRLERDLHRSTQLGWRVVQASALVAREVQEQLDRVPGARLLAFETAHPGRAVIAVGDVETADHVAVLVPGLNAHVLSALSGLVDSAVAVQQRAAAKGGGSVAAVAWIGYDAPGPGSVTSDARAQKGARPLRASLRGLEARPAAVGRDVHLTVSGHSYGSLVAGYALRERTGADDFVALGSPGVGVDRASQLQLPFGHVFAAEAKWDGVADLSRFAADTSSDSFGARRFQTDGRTDPVLGDLKGISWHTSYYARGSESLDNVALITAGQSDRVSYE